MPCFLRPLLGYPERAMGMRWPLRLCLVLLVPGLLACGGGNRSRLTFLLASQEGLERMTVGGGRKAILNWDDQSYPLDPALSPDHSRIAFGLQLPARASAGGGIDFGADLYVARVDGEAPQRLAKHALVAEFLRTPAWLSNSELLYTYRGRTADGVADLHIDRLDLSSGRTSRFIENGVDAAVSNDGTEIVYVAVDPLTQEESLAVASAVIGDRQILVTAENNLALFSSAVFSPDGSTIAFAAVDLSAPLPGGRPAIPTASGAYAAHPFAQDVWTINADGSGLRRLAEIAENMPSLTWSGDGKALYALGPGSLWRIDPTTGRAEQIAPGIPLGQIVWLSGH